MISLCGTARTSAIACTSTDPQRDQGTAVTVGMARNTICRA